MIIDPIEAIAANSFRNFHAKGLDYLCVHRSPELTIKAYFYEHGGRSVPEVVCPHDHRYPFSTHVLAGKSGHHRYNHVTEGRPEPTHEMFEWDTPLNGGAGFKHVGEARLWHASRGTYYSGKSYWCDAPEIHTITIDNDDTILLLYQHADVVPIGKPTRTFSALGKEAPGTDGLYDRMPEDVVVARMKMLQQAIDAAAARS